MSVRGRVEKLESDPRVPEPCWFCGLVERATRIFHDYLTARGARLPGPVYEDRACLVCGAEKRTNITGLTPEDLALEARWLEVIRGGNHAGGGRLGEEYGARCLARGLAVYGEHCAGASEACDEYIRRWFDENAHTLKEAA